MGESKEQEAQHAAAAAAQGEEGGAAAPAAEAPPDPAPVAAAAAAVAGNDGQCAIVSPLVSLKISPCTSVLTSQINLPNHMHMQRDQILQWGKSRTRWVCAAVRWVFLTHLCPADSSAPLSATFRTQYRCPLRAGLHKWLAGVPCREKVGQGRIWVGEWEERPGTRFLCLGAGLHPYSHCSTWK